MILFEKDGEGIAIVKESHKCVNQDGVDTGGFVVTEDACLVTGLGLTSNHYGGGFYLNSSEFAMCWASWTLLYQASGEDERQRAVKEFDRIRYPVDPASDLYTMANTWGSRGAGNLSRRAAEEKNVLRELESCADFGIDILQIDDGWEVPLEGGSPSDSQWLPHAERFPEGWGPVRQAAETLGMRLGLWFSWRAPVERILENVEEGGFSALKIDFANCHIREYLDQLVDLAREIVSRAKRDIRINWDLTENSPRMGYFFGREFGNLYLENKQISPEGASRLRHIAYTPSLVLRDAWELAHYCNLNQFQIPIQNTERVRAELSNAWRYPHRYCFAITMAALPIFFQETHLYSEEAREELKPMIALYKEHRERIAEGIVYPLGEYPSDTGFSGFQSHRHRLGDGYITLFRGIDAPDAAKVVRLRFLPSNRLHVEDLANGHTFTLSTDADGRASFEIPDAGDFRFYRYT
jgi:hypothetical protein